VHVVRQGVDSLLRLLEQGELMPYAGIIFTSLLAAAYFVGPSVRRWWRKGCDGCRVEDLGSQWTHTAHTCFPWRNPYRDKNGNIREFGKIVRKGR
jgi:hypothetical protein